MSDILIGTSGYDYPEWKGVFYPPEVKRADFLAYYATQFNAVELNNTFYNMPTAERLFSFYERSEGRLQFSIKVNRLLTHEIDSQWQNAADDFKTALRPLLEKDNLCAVLFQFPQSFHYTNYNRIYLAKIIAAFVFTVFYIMVCCLAGSLIHITVFGIKGWDLPVQLWNTIIPYQLNAAQACMLNLIVIILLAALLTGISLFISAACKNQVAVLAIDMIVFFGTVFLQASKTSRLWNHICYLFPLHVVDLRDVLKTYNSYQIAGHVFSYIEMIIIVYIVFTVLFTIFAGHIFKKHQVA